MKTDIALRQEASMALSEKPNKVMLLSAGRMCYAGLLGQPTVREFGAITIYVSLQNPFRIQLDNGEWKTTHAQVVQAETPHRIASCDRLIGMLMIEPETVDIDSLPDFLQTSRDIADREQVYERLRTALYSLMYGRVRADDIPERFDRFFFGFDLPQRVMDPRLAAVIERIQCQPCDSFMAEALASEIKLSVSRFLHLFKEEIGTTFRQFRAWKRVRSFLMYVTTELNLTDIAMETGYPSSSHFSYTVRRYWGLAPKDIIAGSRHLAVVHNIGSLTCKRH